MSLRFGFGPNGACPTLLPKWGQTSSPNGAHRFLKALMGRNKHKAQMGRERYLGPEGARRETYKSEAERTIRLNREGRDPCWPSWGFHADLR